MTTYEVRDPADVRKVGNSTHEYLRIGTAIVRPATDAERARVNKAIDALAHGDNLVGQSAYGVVVALREAVGK